MKEKKNHEKYYFLKRTHDELCRLFKVYGIDYSKRKLQLMKLIAKQLNYEIHCCELLEIEQQVLNGKLTPKEGIHKKAEYKRKHPCHRPVIDREMKGKSLKNK